MASKLHTNFVIPGVHGLEDIYGFWRSDVTMPAKAKRTLSVQEDGDTDVSTSPAKRLRTDDSSNGLNGDAPATTEPAELDDVDDEETVQVVPAPVVDDLYLDTVNRSMLEFDFEKVCSVTLTNLNVYGCLVCGKYFNGSPPSRWSS
jgi:U4/U6.U5 tri-snRNP-associated protein 2